MCLAIYKPKGKTISKQALMAGYASNSSGCGYIARIGDELRIFKKLVPFTEFYAEYREIEKDFDIAVHFRAATHGPVNNANCHPFVMCDGKFAMIHNGVFHVPLTDTSLSDTGNYCKYILEPAIKDGSYKDVEKMEKDPRWGWGMVVLMGTNGETIIYKERNGDWDNGVWYSNGCYKWGARFADEDDVKLFPRRYSFWEVED